MDWNKLSHAQYSVNKNIRFKTAMLKDQICVIIVCVYCCKRDSNC